MPTRTHKFLNSKKKFYNFMKITKLTSVLSTSSNVLLVVQCDYVYCELNMLKMWHHETHLIGYEGIKYFDI
jgi:hypothetical protein